jgi:hypothetical protein
MGAKAKAGVTPAVGITGIIGTIEITGTTGTKAEIEVAFGTEALSSYARLNKNSK